MSMSWNAPAGMRWVRERHMKKRRQSEIRL
ncbi:uncharacterized protein G2W53_031942 [Senna tora]|uniref:Uncharacterized protein n=1 Tax=Senna tora TaxID=362788 RepID=A0A834W9V0_9FABA|nr:uncharacterized protein G2W53_031942 [Senna tora]